jgi:hypothetical protein
LLKLLAIEGQAWGGCVGNLFFSHIKNNKKSFGEIKRERRMRAEAS